MQLKSLLTNMMDLKKKVYLHSQVLYSSKTYCYKQHYVGILTT